jgi:hypothetical protein
MKAFMRSSSLPIRALSACSNRPAIRRAEAQFLHVCMPGAVDNANASGIVGQDVRLPYEVLLTRCGCDQHKFKQ